MINLKGALVRTSEITLAEGCLREYQHKLSQNQEKPYHWH